MEHNERNLMFMQNVSEEDVETASNAYLMSLVSLMISLPLPIINLIATGIFLSLNQRSVYHVRWHCMQVLLSQVFILLFNTPSFYFVVKYFLLDEWPPIPILCFIGFVILLNIVEYIITIYTAIQIRKGLHVRWFGFAGITDYLVKS